MILAHFYDPNTNTLTYIVHKKNSNKALIIDPVWDFDPPSGRLYTDSAQQVFQYLEKHNLDPVACFETHAHADHLSGSQVLKKKFPKLEVAISKRITLVQDVFTKVFNIKDKSALNGTRFDRLLDDFEVVDFGGIHVKLIPTPGHTPACSSYLIEDMLFTGDALFMPDSGTGRCDFPAGSARDLYNSIVNHIYTLPDSTRIFVGHDYQPGGRQLAFESSVGEQKANNIHLSANKTEQEFIAMREARDATLNAPKLLLPSIQVNILAGHLPEPEDNGVSYLKLPLRVED